jgi:hypothetical protein
MAATTHSNTRCHSTNSSPPSAWTANPWSPNSTNALSTPPMALKKSELYSSLWASCDELRGGMDASQYKDYVLVLLFIKYISDKYAGKPFAAIKVPEGSSFADMVKLKGKTDIGDQINKAIIAPLAAANSQLSQADFPDFNDPNKLGSGKEMVDRLTNLIAIFENPALDFSKNRAEGDDILGDAYEYLMRHFATESGKSKGQFYTPAEVSRIMAQVIGIGQAATSPDTTVCDPTCGSSSLLLKVADEARTPVSLYGQEKDSATSGLARMNMILHDYPPRRSSRATPSPTRSSSTATRPQAFDFAVANPPFQRQALEQRRRSRARSLPAASRLRRPARQAGRLRLPAPHHPLAQVHRQGSLHSAARRALPGKCRGRHPQKPHPARLPQGHHRPALPTSSTAPASPPASSSSTRNTPPPARASS